MYDINKSESPVSDSQYLDTRKGVVDEEGALAWAKLGQEQRKQEEEDRQRLEMARQAKLDDQLKSIGTAIDPVEAADIAEHQKGLVDLVHSKTPDLYSKDVNKRTDAQLAINQETDKLKNLIAASNARYKEKERVKNMVEGNEDNFYPAELKRWQEKSGQSYVNTPEDDPIKYAPTKNVSLLKLFKDNYQTELERPDVGEQTIQATKNANGQYEVTTTTNKAKAYNNSMDAMLKDPVVNRAVGKYIQLGGNEDAYIKRDANGDPIKDPITGKPVYDAESAIRHLIPFESIRTKTETKNATELPADMRKEGKGEDPNAVTVTNTYNKNTDTNELSFGNPKKPYAPVPVVGGGMESPLEIKIREVSDGRGGKTTVGIGVFPDPFAKKEYQSLLTEKQKIDKLQETAALDVETAPNDDDKKIAQDKVDLLQKQINDNEAQRKMLLDKTVEMQIGGKTDSGQIAVKEIQRAHPTLTAKDVMSYLKNPNAETKNGVIYSGFDKGAKTWQENNGVKPKLAPKHSMK